MAGKKKGKSAPKSDGPHTPLSEHRREKSRFIPPLADTNLHHLDWFRDLAPEYLWMASLALSHGAFRWYGLVNRLLDALDSAIGDSPSLGMISDFGRVPSSARPAFLASHAELIRQAVVEPFGAPLALYPEGPASWLVSGVELTAASKDEAIAKLRTTLLSITDNKSLFTGRIRIVSFARAVGSGRFHLGGATPVIDLMRRYPHDINEEDEQTLFQFARTAMNAFMAPVEAEPPTGSSTASWTAMFWRANLPLAKCLPGQVRVPEYDRLRPVSVERIIEAYTPMLRSLNEFVESTQQTYPYDLYRPRRSEVVLGTMTRAIRMANLFATRDEHWQRDLGAIILRALADTVILFRWLVTEANDDDIDNFVEWSRGKEKLLMLHLQDSYPGQLDLDARTSARVSDSIGGGLQPESLEIDVGNWTNLSTRDMAFKTGLEKIYRMIYATASDDVHGAWSSLSRSCLAHCGEPLHGAHRIPALYNRPMHPVFFAALNELVSSLLVTARDGLKLKAPTIEMPDVRTHFSSIDT